MKMEKLQYSSPAAEIVNVRFERNFMSPPGPEQYTEGGGGSYGDDDITDNGGY